MTLLIHIAILVAALVFITVSAAMNALFLSSLGRMPVEIGLLAAVSIAADITKAVLPVLLARAVVLRAWGYAAATTTMLLLVVALSLASGMGFAAMTRGAVTAEREAKAEQLARRRQELTEIEARIAAFGMVKPAPLIDAELAALKLDRRWTASKSCTDVIVAATRGLCVDAARLEGLSRHAELHSRAIDARRKLVDTIERLQADGAAQDSDHQAAALARFFGGEVERLRIILVSSVAITLELGSILLVLLASGPLLHGWREPGTELLPEAVPATLPVQADRSHWQRQRGRALGAFEQRENA